MPCGRILWRRDIGIARSAVADVLRQLANQGVRYEEIVIVDDTHHWLRFANSVCVYAGRAEYFARILRGKPARGARASPANYGIGAPFLSC